MMLAAELLKLRRNRALMVFGFLLSVVVIVLFFGYSAIEHSSAPSQHSPAGGLLGFSRAVRALGVYFGALTAIMVGAEAGTSDLASGVFRDLVATGRSRWQLFAVRAPAAIIVGLALNGLGFLVGLAGTFIFADGLATPSLAVILESAGWIAMCTVVLSSLAAGVGSLTGSRAITLTSVIGWQTVATQILINVTSLGSARDGLLTPSLTELMPVGHPVGFTGAAATAVVVVIVWLLVPSAVGAWRTATQDA
jgi:hypothetical protein